MTGALNTARSTSWGRSPGSVSETTPPSLVSQKPTAAPNGSSAPSKSNASGPNCTTPSTTSRLESDLLTAGETLVRVYPRLMAGERRGDRERGKSDPIDAATVARVALREPDLPVARLDGPARELRLLADHRETLVRERTRLQNRLRWHLHELDPEFHVRRRGLRAMSQLDRVAARLATMQGLVAELASDLVERCRELNQRINDLERRLRPLVRELGPPLLAIPGCGILSAAKILGETAGVDRFLTAAAFARFNGTAPR